MLPAGKGYYIHKVINCEGGDLDKIVTESTLAGLGHLFVKIADGYGDYNVSVNLRLLFDKLKAANIQPWGWQYVYGNNPIQEARKAVERIKDLGAVGFAVDFEKEYKDPAKATGATSYMETLRAGVGDDFPICSSSYRYPTYHQEIPWKRFRDLMSFDMPQVYWEQSHNPAAQLERSYAEYRAMSPVLPYFPTGSAYVRGTWKPTTDDISEFMAKCLTMGLDGFNFWEYANCRINLPEVWSVVANFAMPLPPEPPEPEPCEEKIAELAGDIEELGGRLDNALLLVDRLNDITAKLQADVEELKAGVTPGVNFVVTESKAVARYAPRINDKGKGIPIIYDGTGGRVIFKTGEAVPALPGYADLDGSVKYYKIVQKSPDGDTLYVRAQDGVLR